MFPNGWPGRALILLRFLTGILLIREELHVQPGAMQWREVISQSVAIAAGWLLICGLWTPVAGVVVVMVELWGALLSEGHLQDHVVLASLGAALAMLGPGIWSIDSRIFGRKRIELHDRLRGSKSPR